VRDLAALSETDSLDCVGDTFARARRCPDIERRCRDDLAYRHGYRPASVTRCVGRRTQDSSRPTQDRLIELIRLDPTPGARHGHPRIHPRSTEDRGPHPRREPAAPGPRVPSTWAVLLHTHRRLRARRPWPKGHRVCWSGPSSRA